MKFLPLLLSLGLTSAALANDFELRYKSVDRYVPELELSVVNNADSSFAEIIMGESVLNLLFEHAMYSRKVINDSLVFITERVDDSYTNSVWNRNSGKVYWANSKGKAGVVEPREGAFSLVDLITHVRENGIDSEIYYVLASKDFQEIPVSFEDGGYKIGLSELNLPFINHGVVFDGDFGVGFTPSGGYLHLGGKRIGLNIDFERTK
jgi:hypothetical protein